MSEETEHPMIDCPQLSASLGDRCEYSDWHGCYDGSWKRVIVREAFAHPAKFARGLIERIVEHGLKNGYWKKGELIGDPLAGIGCGGIISASRGLRWIGVELEPAFVELARESFGLHRRSWEEFGDPCPLIIQGDSRAFARLVADQLQAAITSPPYADTINSQSHGIDWSKTENSTGNRKRGDGCKQGETFDAQLSYGQTPGQIGALPRGTLDALITSPPYADSVQGQHKEQETAQESQEKRQTPGGSLGQSQRHGGYGVSEGQIGALKAGLLDGAVTSPPYETTTESRANDKMSGGPARWAGGSDSGARCKNDYHVPSSQGQIGGTSRETYWEAMAEVYRQMRLAIKPGGVAAIVLKDHIKRGRRVPLCDDTCRLLAAVGFDVFERTRAWLVEEESQPALFDEPITRRKQRKTFFRYLAEQKGSPPIDWEEVIWSRTAQQRLFV